MSRRNRSFFQTLPFLHFLFRELHYKDCILRDKSHQHDQTYQEINVALVTEHPDTEICTGYRNRKRQKYGHRNRPAFVLGCKEEEDEQQRQAQDKPRLASLLLFLIGKSAPFDTDIVRKMVFRNPFQNIHGLA